jgi:hypothetical protein
LTTTLFRPEALEARRQQWLGEVRLVRPPSMSVLVALLVVCAVAIGGWLVLGEYTRKAHVRGLLVLDRDARLQAQLFAPSSALGFIHAQQPVQLRVAAFPHQRFGHQAGQVQQVSATPLPADELAALRLASQPIEPLYRVTVTLEQQHVMANGRAQPLVAGMQLEADVPLERRRLIEWLFAPVLGIAGRV